MFEKKVCWLSNHSYNHINRLLIKLLILNRSIKSLENVIDMSFIVDEKNENILSKYLEIWDDITKLLKKILMWK